MAIDQAGMPAPEDRGYEVEQFDENLRITIKRNFDTVKDSHTWASVVARACMGPYAAAEVDLSRMVMLSSTLIAGLVHIRDHFANMDLDVTIVGASERTKRSLEMMKLDTLFSWGELRS